MTATPLDGDPVEALAKQLAEAPAGTKIETPFGSLTDTALDHAWTALGRDIDVSVTVLCTRAALYAVEVTRNDPIPPTLQLNDDCSNLVDAMFCGRHLLIEVRPPGRSEIGGYELRVMLLNKDHRVTGQQILPINDPNLLTEHKRALLTQLLDMLAQVRRLPESAAPGERTPLT